MKAALHSYVDSETIQRLRQSNNIVACGHLLVRVAIHLLLLIAFAKLISGYPIFAVIVWYLYATQLQFWGYAGIGHELFHNKVFSSRAVNQFLFKMASVITWNNYALFAKGHAYYHQNTFAADDGEAKSEQSWSPRHIAAYLLIDFGLIKRRLYYTLSNSLGYYPGGVKIQDVRVVNAARLTLILNAVALAIVAYLSADLIVTFLFFLAPFTATLLNKLLAKAQHFDLETQASAGPLQHSRTLHLPFWLSFYYANMNYHAEHHLAPFIPYYHLPELHRLLSVQGHVSSVSFVDFIKLFSRQSNRPALT